MTALDQVRDRALGCFLGLAVGDALGTTLEFYERDTYQPITGMVGGGMLARKPGEWTDDTSMALALAESLVECGDFNERDFLARLVDWWRRGEYSCVGTCDDIGALTQQALSRWLSSGEVHAGRTDTRAAGNGSLVRVAPVAIRFWNDRSALIDAAWRQSLTTHGALEAVDACVAFAELLAQAISGTPPAELLRPREINAAPRIAAIFAGSWVGKQREQIASSGYVVHSLEAALWCVGTSSSFDEAVLKAANLGGDADSTAASAGQLAGAIYGMNGIPQDYLQLLAWRTRLEDAALRLFKQACAPER